jgi:hypothetical protein
MSFFSDLFRGNFSNLGNDITHAPSSLVNHPDQLAEVLGGAALLTGGLAFAPEIGAAIGGGALAADAGAAGAAAADSALIGDAALTADAALAGDAAAIGGDTALAFAPDLVAPAFDIAGPGLGADVLASSELAPYLSGGGDVLAAGADTAAGSEAATTANAVLDSEVAGGGVAPASGTVPAGGGASATPPGFAPTDAELSGATTGTAPATTTGGAATTGGGITDKLGNLLSNPWTKLGLAATPLALTLAMGETQLPSSARQLQGQATALQQQGLTDLSNARNGVLNSGQTAVLGQMRTDLQNQWRQTLFNQGVQDPTKDARWPQIEAQIDAQVTQQTATLIQQNITNALAETGQASTALTSIANMQFQADQNFTNALVNATKSLGLAAGLSSGGVTIKTG